MSSRLIQHVGRAGGLRDPLGIRHSLLTRRRFLSTSAAAASILPMSQALAAPSCVLNAEQEVGPFYLADEMLRASIAEDRQGIPLRLRLVVMDTRTCAPLTNAAIDLWHCDAMGLYAGFTATKLGPPPGGGPGGFGGPGGPPPLPGERPGGIEGQHEGPPHDGQGPPQMRATDKLTFLRGIQMTGTDGSVTFETIFPGFYDGRTNHVHYKVRLDGHRQGKTYAAGHTSHVGQVFFPEDWNVRLMAKGPYATHPIHRTTAAEDMVFQGQHGIASIAMLLPVDPKRPEQGLIAELRVGVDPTATPKPVGGMGGPPA
jgi:protocatechuate 3,4-dioxygenase beta subunit